MACRCITITIKLRVTEVSSARSLIDKLLDSMSTLDFWWAVGITCWFRYFDKL
jgi:hypothetical protein